MSMEQKLLESVMGLILNSGNAKSDAMEAIQAAKVSDFKLADEKILSAEKSLLEAHHSQTELLSKEASGSPVELSLLMIHGQDHLMTSISFKEIAQEFIDLYKRINKIC